MRAGISHWFSRKTQLFFMVLCLLCSLASPAFANSEFVDQFYSYITVETDGSIIVAENIDVQIAGYEFRRGFIRDIPEFRVNREGRRYKTPVEVLSVTRNGQKEPYKESRSSGTLSIRIGSADVMLKPGLHRYVVRYRAHRQVTFFDDYDELYWNVTGNDWTVPIEKAMASVVLPEGGKVHQTGGWLGYRGSRNQQPNWSEAPDVREVDFESARPLAPGMGLTIALTFAKGVVMPPAPTWAEKMGPLPLVTAFLVLAMLIGGVFWFRWGRDRPRDMVIPLYHAPEGISPASARLIHSGSIDNVSFASNVISLAVKGYLTIDSNVENDEEYCLTGTGTKKGATLTRDEEALFKGLKLHKSPVVFDASQAQQIASANSAMEAGIEMVCDGLVKKNMGPRLLYMALMGLLSVLAVWGVTGEEETALLTLVVVWFSVGMSLLTASLFSHVVHWFRKKPSGKIVRVLPRILGKGALLLFTFPWITSTMAVLAQLKYILSDHGDLTQIWFPMAFAVGLMMAFWLWYMDAPTEKGVALTAQIEGLKLYIAMAEADRMNLLNSPGPTPEHFEELLPYALALDLEEAWAASFARLLNQTSAEVETWHPQWSGSLVGSPAFSLQSFHHMSTGISSNFQSVLNTLSASRGSSSSGSAFSGGGGGGFSGGGGGGGGGRGW